MAYSSETVVSDGTLTTHNIAIDYQEREDIHVYFDDVEDAYGWVWVGETEKTIDFSTTIPLGVVVRIQRETELDLPRHIFGPREQGGSAQFTDRAIDENFDQFLKIAQEARETAETNVDFITDRMDAVEQVSATAYSTSVTALDQSDTALSQSAQAAQDAAQAVLDVAGAEQAAEDATVAANAATAAASAATSAAAAAQQAADDAASAIDPRPDLANDTDPAKGAAMIGYRGRSLSDVMGDVKNVRNFGAVGDGVANDSAAIQAALNDGGVVLFPEGVYNVPTAIQVVQDGTTLISEGAKLTSNTSSVVDVISAVGITGLRISGFEIDGRRDLKAGLGQRSGRGIRLLNCHDVQVSNCLVYHCIEHGMVNSGTTGNATQDHSRVIVSNCIFRDNGNPQTSRGVGIWGGWWRARDVVINGNVFVDNEGGGIFIDDVSGSAEPDGENRRVAITGNVIYTTLTSLADPGGTHMGIGYAGSTDFVITGNFVQGYAVALLLDDSQANALTGRGVVSGNYLKGYNRAVRIDNVSSVLFAGNRFEIFDGGSTLVYAVNDRTGGTNIAYDLTFSGNVGYTSATGYDIGRVSSGVPSGLLQGIRVINDVIKFTGGSAAVSGQNGIFIRACPDFEISGVSVDGFYNNINVEPFGYGVVKGATLKNAVNYNATVTDVVSYKDCIMSGAGTADLRVNGSGNVPDVMLMGNWFRSPTPTSVSGGTLNTTRSGNYPAI